MHINKLLLYSGHRLFVGGDYKKTSITIHSTGNPLSSAQSERKWLDNPTNKRNASWHYCVDQYCAIQAIEDNNEAWHCGMDYGNMFSIGIEICENGNRLKTLQNAVDLVTDKLIEYNLSITDIKTHYDWTGKNCPRILLNDNYIKDGLDWDWFIAQCKEKLEMKTTDMTQEQFNIYMDNYLKSRNVLPASTWAESTQKTAIDLGITDGTNPQMFATREQVVAMIVRAMKN